MEKIHRLKELATDLSVLIVEDDEKLRVESANLLQKFFTIVNVARNGKEGLELYAKNRYDIVISDIKMPLVNGVEMIQQIRMQNPNQVVIVMSAYDFTDLLEPFLHQKVNAFLAKPVSTHNLISTLTDVIEKNLLKHTKYYTEYELLQKHELEIQEIKEELSKINSKMDTILELLKAKL